MTVVEELWVGAAAGERRARDQLILHYRPLVDRVASSLTPNLPRSVERDDLVGYGVFGLIDAIDKYDASQGASFETYAFGRIRGAILDGLRSVDWVSKKLRKRTREMERTRGRLESKLGRVPSTHEIAVEMGVTDEQVERMLTEAFTSSLVAYDDAPHEPRLDNHDPMLIDVDELRERLAEAIVALPDRERIVFTLYYVEQVTFDVIGECLGVKKAWISFIRDEAILRVRAHLSRHP